MSALGGNLPLSRTCNDHLMSILMPTAILAFFVSPFASAGFRRAWRAAAAVLLLLGLYAGFLWSQPIPASYDQQDELGAAAWRAVVSIILAGSLGGFAAGFGLSTLRLRYPRTDRK
jgi:hypothetical protein